MIQPQLRQSNITESQDTSSLRIRGLTKEARPIPSLPTTGVKLSPPLASHRIPSHEQARGAYEAHQQSCRIGIGRGEISPPRHHPPGSGPHVLASLPPGHPMSLKSGSPRRQSRVLGNWVNSPSCRVAA